MPNRINYQMETGKSFAAAWRYQAHAAAACLLRAVLQRHAGTAGRAFPAFHFHIITPTSTRPPSITRREAELEALCRAGRLSLPGHRAALRARTSSTPPSKGWSRSPRRASCCTVCYRLRLEQTAKYAAAHGFDWFCTTLSISPMKDPIRINALGQQLGGQYGVRFFAQRVPAKRTATSAVCS